ncbi:MAG: hypothetical protein WKG00_34900 [Polyangiaceae bacterium]
MARRAAVAMALALGTACGSLIGFEDGYTTAPPDAGTGGEAGHGGDGATGGGGGGGAGGGGQGGEVACAHELCVLGNELDAACDPCVATVCEKNAFCCENGWEPDCVAAAADLCDFDCCGDGRCLAETCTTCPEDCGACPCAHPVCTAGVALDASQCFQPCGDEVCGAMPECCGEYGWTIECTELTLTLCPVDTCITAVCDDDPSCCSTGWTASCVGLASQKDAACATDCGCAHPPCITGPALAATCDPCVAAACEADPFCCNTFWDLLCASYVQSICGSKC